MRVSQRILPVIWKVILRCAVFLLGLFVFAILLGGIFPAGLETKAVRQAHAFLFPNYSDSEPEHLPNRVEFTLDRDTAAFAKGSQAYDILTGLLQNGRSETLQAQRQLIPHPRHPVGELRIVSYGIASHFKIFRSDIDPNAYWIALPKLTSPGTSFPLFTLDPHVIEFIKSASFQQRDVPDLIEKIPPWERIGNIGESIHEIALCLYALGVISIAFFDRGSPVTRFFPLLSAIGYVISTASLVPYAGSLLLLCVIASGGWILLFHSRAWLKRGTGIAGLLLFATAAPMSLAGLLAPTLAPAEVNSHFSDKWLTERWLNDDLRPPSISTKLDIPAADASLKLWSEATEATVFSIDPKFRDRNPATPGTLCGYKIRKQLALPLKVAASVAESVISDVKKWRDTDGILADCFDPHHAVEIQTSQGRYDYVLCYECGVIAVFKDNTLLGGIGFSGSPAVLNQLLYPTTPR